MRKKALNIGTTTATESSAMNVKAKKSVKFIDLCVHVLPEANYTKPSREQ